MTGAGPGPLDLDWLLAAASDLLAIPSTADRPDQLHRALEYVLDFVGPGFGVRRFESAGSSPPVSPAHWCTPGVPREPKIRPSR